MGHGFGELYKLRGIITYRLSPFEQRAFAGFFKHGFPNSLRRIREEIFYVCPPLLIGYAIYSQMENLHKQYARKDPKEFENDQ